MIEGLKSALEEIDARIKRDQAKRKALKKLIKLEEGEAAPQTGVPKTEEKGEVAEVRKGTQKYSEPKKPTPKPMPFDIPFEGHRFIFFSEAYTDKDGKEYPERGWLPVDPARLKSLYKDCLIKVSDAEDLPLAKDGCNVFKVVEDVKDSDAGVTVVVQEG